jgi:WD40 repeat protein
LAFSPDGCTLAATSDRNRTLGIWDLRANSFRRCHPHVDGFPKSLAYSPDGNILAVGGEGGLVLPYIVANNNYDTECDAGGNLLRARPDPADAVAFAPGAKADPVLATVSFEVRLWDFMEGSLWGEALPGEEAAYFGSLAWSADNRQLAAGDAETCSVTVWKLNGRFRLMDHWLIPLGHEWGSDPRK